MNKPLLVVLSLGASLLCGMAQGVDPLAPSSRNPKPVRPEPAPAKDPAKLQSPRPNPEGGKPINPDQSNLAIKAIIIVPSREAIQEGGVSSASGLDVRGVPFLRTPEFANRISPFLGKLMTENTIRDLEDAIILYCRNQGKVLVDVILPEQNIENGVLQLWFLEGKIGSLSVKNEGRKWFKDAFILENTRLQSGAPVDSFALTENLDWLNNNPFRQVDAVFKPGDKLGLTDVELQVEDRLPVRAYLGYEDSGTRYSGPDRLLTGFNWGNAFGLDHQLNFQYMTDVEFDLVKASSGSYIVPLPWHDALMLYGSYADVKGEFDTNTTAKGTSWQTSLRYSMPLPNHKEYRHLLSAGFDFKRGNNNLEFGGITVNPSDTDVAQFALNYSGTAPDRYGRTSFGLDFFYSPGDLTEYNSDTNYWKLRQHAKAAYVYTRINAERITSLPYGFTWVLKGWGQLASERLLPSEELGLGGYETIRGYDERVINGDNGWIIINELRTPPISIGEMVHMPSWNDQLQFLVFFDYGGVRVVDNVPADGDDPNKDLYSVGGGLRCTVSRNFSLRFDWGFPLTEKNINEYSSRGHIGAMLSY